MPKKWAIYLKALALAVITVIRILTEEETP